MSKVIKKARKKKTKKNKKKMNSLEAMIKKETSISKYL